ncbi:hypothetical protein [Mycobacterium genavense]|uniref:hypothetical protein n=1 Tax=Mycobacterium genavense TaxID=36812 RepID=UPI00046E85C1|nr:hypothetical protein [Mycobacterium genavense]
MSTKVSVLRMRPGAVLQPVVHLGTLCGTHIPGQLVLLDHLVADEATGHGIRAHTGNARSKIFAAVVCTADAFELFAEAAQVDDEPGGVYEYVHLRFLSMMVRRLGGAPVGR